MNRVGRLLEWGGRHLGGGSEATSESLILLAHVLQKDRGWLYAWPEAGIADSDAARFRELIERRATGTPVAYLTGSREFWSLPLAVDEHTLIPRAETEQLVEFVLQRWPSRTPAQLIDLGTGSGAIALALAAERPAWLISASDRSLPALERARRNAREHGLQVNFLAADWLQGIAGPFDLIVSNPPYVASGDAHLDRGDLRFEPRGALAAGKDGLRDIRIIISQARSRLRDNGWLVFEHGIAQGLACRELLYQAGYREIGTGQDLSGRDRFSYARA